MLSRGDSQYTAAVAAASTPADWWREFCNDYLSIQNNSMVTFQRLSQATEKFRPDEWRRDPAFLKIWLLYLEAHLALYGDLEEVRRLFRFLKSEHVGLDQAEFHLHQAQLELCSSKPEKCLAILEAASKIPALNSNEQLRRALVEFKLVGSFRLEPLICPLSGLEGTTHGQKSGQTFTPQSNAGAALVSEHIQPFSSTITMPFGSASFENLDSANMQNRLASTMTRMNFISPPTPMSQPTRDELKHVSMMTPAPLEIIPEHEARAALESMTKQSLREPSPSEVQNSAFTTRIRRLGNLGPPKRAIIGNNSASPKPSPKDRLLLADVEMMDQSLAPSVAKSSTPSPIGSVINSPSKHSKMEMTIDKENMSLTTVSPTRITREQAERSSSSPPHHHHKTEGPSTNAASSKSRAVRVNGKTYKVLQMIGRGGSSKVFKVLAPDNVILALKKVGLRNLDDVTLSGYLNEIDLLRTFRDSPHIIKLIDHEINRDHGNLYMLMEFGEADLGHLLRDAHKREGGPSNNFIRYMWQQMLQAVMTVHAAKIVHCDLKPANFLLVGGMLKLIDFGISKAIMNDTTNIVRENQVGTVNYMSPEALQESSGSERGRIKIGRASDVWSLGCILYEMVYGKPPFAQFTLIQRLHRILDTAYDIPFGPVEDASLLHAIKGCLQRIAKRRPTLEELMVHPFLKPQAPSVSPDSVVVSRRQLLDLMEKFGKHIPQLDAAGLAEKIFLQWSKESASR